MYLKESGEGEVQGRSGEGQGQGRSRVEGKDQQLTSQSNHSNFQKLTYLLFLIFAVIPGKYKLFCFKW